MSFRFVIFFILVISCAPVEKKNIVNFNKSYSNAGFALVYNHEDFEKRIISKKIDERSLIIFQKNLKPKTSVKITNIVNDKSIIAVVGENAKYPPFFNSVLSKRVAESIELNLKEPYVQILEINEKSTFLASKAKTFEEEREVAEKAPVLEIGIKDLNPQATKKLDHKNSTNQFLYVIKIADFYYLETAKLLKKRIYNDFNVKVAKINKLSKTKFRVYLGPYRSFESIKIDFNKILGLQFENIEIIKL